MKKFLCLLALISLNLWAVENTPTIRVNQSIEFSDDMRFENLELAIDRQLVAYAANGLAGTIRFGNTTYKKTVLRDSLLTLKSIARDGKNCLLERALIDCLNNFNVDINNNFAIYRPLPSKSEAGYSKPRELSSKFTSYYSPDMTGSTVRTARYNRPIYGLPRDTRDQNFTRVQIDFQGALRGKGLELFWVDNSFFDIYLLHVQGGGRIRIQNDDGTETIKYLSFAGKNARTFKMIYHYMIANGMLKSGEAGVPAQRKYLNEHPEDAESIFGSCPSYVYFKVTEEEPVGLDNIPLTEGRSLANDNGIYKTTGIINFVKTKKPSHINDNGQVVKSPFARFFVSQDTGGAIKGNARSDLYQGYGEMAEFTAYNMDDLGEQYFLIKK